jgi:isocitrate dehydrogenase
MGIVEILKGRLKVPKDVEIGYIEGDGIGAEVIPQAMRVVEKAIELTYRDRSIEWVELKAGKKALREVGTLLPEETIEK